MNKNRKKSKSNNNIPSEIITSPGLSSDLQISISTKRGEASKSLEEIRLELNQAVNLNGNHVEVSQPLTYAVSSIDTLLKELQISRKRSCELQEKLDVCLRKDLNAKELESLRAEMKVLQNKLSVAEDFMSRIIVVGVLVVAVVITAFLVPFLTWVVHQALSLFI